MAKKKKKKRKIGVPKRKAPGGINLPTKIEIPDEFGDVGNLDLTLRLGSDGEPRIVPVDPNKKKLWEQIITHKDFDPKSIEVDDSMLKRVSMGGTITGPAKKGTGRAAVDTYMQMMGWLYKNSHQSPFSIVDYGIQKLLRHWRYLWALLKDSRVIEFPVDAWFRLLEQQESLMEHAHLEDMSFSQRIDIISRGNGAHPPEHVPFELMWIGLEGGVDIRASESGWLSRMCKHGPLSEVDGSIELLGYQVNVNQKGEWPDSAVGFHICEVYYVVRNKTAVIWPITCSFVENEDTGAVGWERESDGPAIFMVNMILGIINEHRRFVIEKGKGRKAQRALNKAGRKQGAIGYVPAPYYVVRLQDELVEDVLRSEKKARKRILGHRYDRRGHERCYIRRGPLPLEEETRAKLEHAGYEIFTTERPDATNARRVAERGMRPKRQDEWLAVLTRWIDETICGDESLPYVPAVRVPTKLAV